MEARSLYPHAGRDRWPPPWNAPEPDEHEKRRKWEKDVEQQLADDRRAFARYFRPNSDLRTITGGNALGEVQNFVRDALRVAHWKLPTDNEGIRRMLGEAVVNKRLIPVVNREYRGQPRVAQPDPAPLRWPTTSAAAAAGPEIISYIDFVALQRANGELGGRASLAAAPGSAQPFAYTEDLADGDVFDIAARGVSKAQEAECFAEYEARLEQCKLYAAMSGDPYTYVSCKANAFRLYNQCRGH